MSHRSWTRERVDSYERLEFLGDSVLGLIVTQELLTRHPGASEGDLAWMRQGIVCRVTCAQVAHDAGLPAAMLAAAPADHRDAARAMTLGTQVPAGLAEAVIGAAWLDLGPGPTRDAVLAAFGPALDAAVPGRRDAKTALQELVAAGRQTLSYRLVATEGPAHDRRFRSAAMIDGVQRGVGAGRSKQLSEREAAVAALVALEHAPDRVP